MIELLVEHGVEKIAGDNPSAELQRRPVYCRLQNGRPDVDGVSAPLGYDGGSPMRSEGEPRDNES